LCKRLSTNLSSSFFNPAAIKGGGDFGKSTSRCGAGWGQITHKCYVKAQFIFHFAIFLLISFFWLWLLVFLSLIFLSFGNGIQKCSRNVLFGISISSSSKLE